jgi:hypothetical protein
MSELDDYNDDKGEDNEKGNSEVVRLLNQARRHEDVRGELSYSSTHY